ncbi:hypothetical protein AeMF1_011760 [Aphanomyces euteiches]|nr:hypothetical protein AeMF1_011760 [Aphanomyces euteiches]
MIVDHGAFDNGVGGQTTANSTVALFRQSKLPIEAFSQADEVARAYASSGQLSEAFFLQARLVEQTTFQSRAYVDRVLVSMTLLMEAGEFAACCDCLLSLLHRMPLPLTRQDGLFLLAYAKARSGNLAQAHLSWRQSLGCLWKSLLESSAIWKRVARQYFAAGLWTFAALFFAEAIPSPQAILHVVPMPMEEPDAASLNLYILSMLHRPRPDFDAINAILDLAIATAARYDADIRALCVKLHRTDFTSSFGLEKQAVAFLVRVFRRHLTWRYDRPRYWMEIAADGFRSYRRPPVTKSKPKKAKRMVGATSPVVVKPQDEKLKERPMESINEPEATEEVEDLLAVYASHSPDDLESRLRYILHRAKTIAAPDSATSRKISSLDAIKPSWLKELEDMRRVVDRKGYMTEWKATLVRHLGHVVSAMEATHGPTKGSRIVRSLRRDLETCHVTKEFPLRLDHAIEVTMDEEAKRNLVFYHALHLTEPRATHRD